MKYYYEITAAREVGPDLPPHTGYGLLCRRGQEILAEFRDLSPDREAVEAAAALFRQEQPEPVHLGDILYDMLADGLL